MRIAVWHNLPSGGGKRALYDHVRGLVERGHHVEAWCPPTANRRYLPLADLVTEHVTPLRWNAEGGSLARLQPMYWNMHSKIAAMDEHCRLCAEQIQAGGFDVLYAASCFVFTTTSIGRQAGLPSLLYLQEPNRPMYEALPELIWAAPRLGGAAWRPTNLRQWTANTARTLMLRAKVRAEIDNARAYDRIVVNSYFSRESILRTYGLDAHVCYLGVDTQHFVDQGLPRENFVVGLGAIITLKNIHFLIDALGRMPRPRPRLVWVGNAADESYLASLTRLAQEHGVDFAPEVNISDEELINLLNRAAAMLYAPRLEPFGYAPLEAGACGCPVITVFEGGMKETVVDGVNGLVTDPEPAAMAAALTRLLADPQLGDRLGSQARAFVQERFSLPAAIDRIEAELGAVIARRTPLESAA
jgi:glycosyltransferase involved in cell wall biosynthesis